MQSGVITIDEIKCKQKYKLILNELDNQICNVYYYNICMCLKDYSIKQKGNN